MPIIQSAKKALRQSKKRQAKNLQKKNAYKNSVKELKKSVTAGKNADTANLLSKAYKAIDKAAKTGVIKKNKAARLKSKASKLLKQKAS